VRKSRQKSSFPRSHGSLPVTVDCDAVVEDEERDDPQDARGEGPLLVGAGNEAPKPDRLERRQRRLDRVDRGHRHGDRGRRLPTTASVPIGSASAGRSGSRSPVIASQKRAFHSLASAFEIRPTPRRASSAPPALASADETTSGGSRVNGIRRRFRASSRRRWRYWRASGVIVGRMMQLESRPVGRGSRPIRRWRNDRQRKKKERARRRAARRGRGA